MPRGELVRGIRKLRASGKATPWDDKKAACERVGLNHGTAREGAMYCRRYGVWLIQVVAQGCTILSIFALSKLFIRFPLGLHLVACTVFNLRHLSVYGRNQSTYKGLSPLPR